MAIASTESGFTFHNRPIPVPGDMRITWRVALLLFILAKSRGSRSSLARLHVIADACRSSVKAKLLTEIIASGLPPRDWRLTIEPALGRALDLMEGERLIQWVSTAKGIGVSLTAGGKSAAQEIEKDNEVLLGERELIRAVSGGVNEAFVARLLKADPK